MPSASVWRMPNGPARFGPIRFCMPAITLRSNHTMNMVAMSRKAKQMTTLTRVISTYGRPTPSRRADRRGSRPERASEVLHPEVDDGGGRVEQLAAAAPGWLNGSQARPRGTRRRPPP